MKKSELRKIIREELLKESTYIGGHYINKTLPTIKQIFKGLEAAIKQSPEYKANRKDFDSVLRSLDKVYSDTAGGISKALFPIQNFHSGA